MIDYARLSRGDPTAPPAPLYARLQRAMVEQITDGTIRPGEKLPSERELQEGLGLSRATVRQALQGLIEEGLVQAVPRSGNYVLEHQAASPPILPPLTGNDAQVVGFLVDFPSFHIYYSQMAAAFNQRLRQAGWRIEMALHNSDRDLLQGALNTMLMQGVRVFAIQPPAYLDLVPLLDDLLSHGALVQIVGRRIDFPRCDYIGADNELLGYQAARHLIEQGHNRIIYRGLTAHTTGRDRAAGYVRAMLESGLAPHIFNAHSFDDHVHAALFLPYLDPNDTIEELIHQAQEQKITAAFCFNDDVGVRLFGDLRQHGLEVPRDFSLVSVDHIPFYGHKTAPLTSFALPGEQMGRQAAELLLRRIAGETFPPQKVLLPARLIEGQSVAPRRGE